MMMMMMMMEKIRLRTRRMDGDRKDIKRRGGEVVAVTGKVASVLN
jgi:hypothetical protein